MVKAHSIVLFLRGMPDHLVIEVREEESQRLWSSLTGADANQAPGYAVLRTLDSRILVINVAHVQVARLVWDPVAAPPDITLNDDEQVRAYLRERGWIDLGYTEEPIALYSIVEELEALADPQGFLSYEDEDGEDVFINSRDLVCLSIPSWLFDEGKQAAQSEYVRVEASVGSRKKPKPARVARAPRKQA